MKSACSAVLVVMVACASPPPAQPPQAAQLARAVSAPDRLAPPEDLPGTARALLRTRMAGHAQQMSALVSDIMILKYPAIATHAAEVAAEPHFARPLTADAAELNSALPEKFFEHDGELRRLARDLEQAAQAMDAFAVARVYGQMSEACVSCHATYRAGR